MIQYMNITPEYILTLSKLDYIIIHLKSLEDKQKMLQKKQFEWTW